MTGRPPRGNHGGVNTAAPTRSEVLAVLVEAVVTVLEVPPDRVTLTTDLANDLAADSLALVEIVEIVEERLAPRAPAGFHVDDDALDGLRTVGDALEHAMAQLTTGDHQ